MLHAPCLTAWLWFRCSSRPRSGGVPHSVYLHLLTLQRIDEGLPLRWVKALIDIDLIPDLFWGVLVVILLIPGHGLVVLPVILYHVPHIVDEVPRQGISFLLWEAGFCLQVIYHIGLPYKIPGSLLRVYLHGLYLLLTEGNRLVGVHGQPHLRQVLPHGFGVVPGMSYVGTLNPWRCLPTSIPVQTLSVDVVTELLPPSLSLSLGHLANCPNSSSNP